MKLTKTALLLILTLTQEAAAQKLIPPDKTYPDGAVEFYTYKEMGMTITSVPGSFEFLFIPENAGVFESVAHEHHYKFMINASYFDGSALQAGHSGWLRIYGNKISPLRIDEQLTHVVRYDSSTHATKFVHCTSFDSSAADRAIEFQTGPLIIDSNKVATEFIRHSINGSGRYKRTLLATVNNSQLYFITVTNRVSLDSLAKYLITLQVFAPGRLDVINLDGGSSVALFVQDYPELNYNEDAHLPILIGVK